MTRSIQQQRQHIAEFLKSIDTTDLDGGVLPVDLFNEWFEEIQETAPLMGMVRTVPMPREKMRIPKIVVGGRIRQAHAEGTEPTSEEDATTEFVELDAEKSSLYWSLTAEAVEDTVAETANTVFNMMNQQFAVDTQDLGINGDGTTSGFLSQNEGWLHIADDRGMPEYSHDDAGTPQPIDDSVFHETLQMIEGKYLRPINGQEPVFMTSRQQVQEYGHSLIERETPLGDSILFGQVDLEPFGYDLVGLPTFPQDQALFTNPQNLIYGLYREVEIDAMQQSDKIFEEDLAGRWAIRVRDDFEIEDENAGVLITSLEDPTA